MHPLVNADPEEGDEEETRNASEAEQARCGATCLLLTLVLMQGCVVVLYHGASTVDR